MPINSKDIQTKDVYPVAASEPVGDVLARLPQQRNLRAFSYIVIIDSATSYRVALWLEIEQIASNLSGNLLAMPIGTLPGLPAASIAVDADTSNSQDAKELRDDQPGKRLVVLKDGAVFGLMKITERSGAALGDDPFAGDSRHQASAPAQRETAPPPFDVVLSGDEATQPTQPEEAKPAEPPVDNRQINAWLNDHEKDEPLTVGESYELKFSVEPPRKDAVGTAGFDSAKLFPTAQPEITQVDLIVTISSDDFEIIGEDQGTILVPRTGKSRKNSTFTISPKKNGVGTIQAFFLANNRIFQQMKITLQVGAIAPETQVISAESSGKTLTAAFTPVRNQEIDLVIIKREAGYEFLLTGGGFKRATVNLTEPQINDLIATARSELKNVIYTKDGGRFAYQGADTMISPTVHEQALKTLMGVGTDLFETLFFAPGSGADAQEMGKLLRQKSQAGKLEISIVAERFAFPWALLYDREYDRNNVNPDGFWGFKHVIEYTPEFRAATTVNFTPEITVNGPLELGFVLNNTIDDELQRKGLPVAVVKPQQEFIAALPNVKVTEYATGDDLIKLLRDSEGKTQFIYFYCHAVSTLPGETPTAAGAPLGVDASKLVLSDGPISLKDLKRSAPLSGANMQSCPLVFLNACESAELSPELYDGLVPYLIAKGARGVLGTEANTPALFAAEFAKVFLERFLAGGQPIGELLLQMRREYLQNKNNVMGLVYALHSGAAVVVQRN